MEVWTPVQQLAATPTGTGVLFASLPGLPGTQYLDFGSINTTSALQFCVSLGGTAWETTALSLSWYGCMADDNAGGVIGGSPGPLLGSYTQAAGGVPNTYGALTTTMPLRYMSVAVDVSAFGAGSDCNLYFAAASQMES